MMSEKKHRANQENARKSTGPRTAIGKSRASRNARRHGFSVPFTDTGFGERVERLARKLCEKDSFLYRWDAAVGVAEAQVMIERIRTCRAAALFLRKPCEKPRPPRKLTMFFSYEEFEALKEAVAKDNVREVKRLIWLPTKRYKAVIKALLAGDRSLFHYHHTERWRDPIEHATEEQQALTEEQQRLEALVTNAPDLASLERYEQRALAKRRRAMRLFAALYDG